VIVTVDTNDSRPIYQQVADGIKELIAQGRLTRGTALPSVRQLAGDLGVNLNTVATAYRELQREGLITITQGAGSVVTSGIAAERSESELLKPLRAALTDLVLSGLSASKLQSLVLKELKGAGKTGKT
jgi:GntR family transcriptional regulator